MNREQLIEKAATAIEETATLSIYGSRATIVNPRVVAEATLAVFEEAHAPTGPAFIDIMPPSPETAKRWWSMYCRECGIEEGMADSADDARLVARRDEHNRTVHAPTDDEREEWLAGERSVADAMQYVANPTDDERSPEFEALEQELFKHQPVLSMQDGSIAGCQCMDRVFYKRTEGWGTHLAEVFTALRRTVQGEPEGEHVFIERYGMHHAKFGGIGGDATSLILTREAWKAMGEPDVLSVWWLPVDENGEDR